MPEDDRLSAVIGLVYDAALEPSRWREALLATRDYVGGFSAAIYSARPDRRLGVLHHDCGTMEPRWHRLYFAQYVKLNPAAPQQMMYPVCEPMASDDLIPNEELYRTRLYKEWVKPQGLIDFVAANLDRSADTAATAIVFRHESHGLTDAGARRRMGLLAPHLRRAVLICRLLDENATATALVEACDGLATAMFLVAADRSIVHANAAGRALLDEGRVIGAEQGRLTATDAQAARALKEALDNAAAGDASLGTTGIAVPLPAHEGSHHVAHVLPMTSGARRGAGTRYAAVATDFVRRAGMEAPPPAEAISKMFGLTAAELRVCFAIVQLGSVPETALALGFQESTVKTHLNRLFAKTGCSRQADLVRLMADFASPLADKSR